VPKPSCANGCPKEAFCRGLCPACYQRARTAGFKKPVRPEGTWRLIPGFEGLYDVATDGRVWSYPRATTPGGLIRHRLDDHGYHQVTLSKDGKHTTHRVHLLVLLAFRGPCPPGKEGAHDDGDKNNNTLPNLWYKTRGENIADQVLHGTHPWASKVHCPYGHEYTLENTGHYTNGGRWCRICGRSRQCRNPDCMRLNHDHVNTPWPAGAALIARERWRAGDRAG
jgi:NUMOD4 motif/HNH endonuclease